MEHMSYIFYIPSIKQRVLYRRTCHDYTEQVRYRLIVPFQAILRKRMQQLRNFPSLGKFLLRILHVAHYLIFCKISPNLA